MTGKETPRFFTAELLAWIGLGFFLTAVPKADVFVDREWAFASSAHVRLQIPDTLAIDIRFPNAIPPDNLIGYNRFRVAVSDTFNREIPGYEPGLYIECDAGFLYFDHDLEISFPYGKGLVPETRQGAFAFFIDPFPVVKIHQWFPADSVLLDTVSRCVGIRYVHKKYTPPPGNGLPKSAKTAIASTGYPFNYGLFYREGLGVRPLREDQDYPFPAITWSREGFSFSLPSRGQSEVFTRFVLLTLKGRKIAAHAIYNGETRFAFHPPAFGVYQLQIYSNKKKRRRIFVFGKP